MILLVTVLSYLVGSTRDYPALPLFSRQEALLGLFPRGHWPDSWRNENLFKVCPRAVARICPLREEFRIVGT